MASKIHPKSTLLSSSSSPDRWIPGRREVFTVWMKSLVMNSHGCTVFDSAGRLAYRVDNYDCKYSTQVHLMDHTGKLIITIKKKKFRFFETWEGSRSTVQSSFFSVAEDPCLPLFRVRRKWTAQSYDVRTWTGDDERRPTTQICMEESSNGKSAATCKIIHGGDGGRRLVAQVKQKQSWSSGVLLGDDVLTFAVEPEFDHDLAVGLLIVNQLFNHKL